MKKVTVIKDHHVTFIIFQNKSWFCITKELLANRNRHYLIYVSAHGMKIICGAEWKVSMTRAFITAHLLSCKVKRELKMCIAAHGKTNRRFLLRDACPRRVWIIGCTWSLIMAVHVYKNIWLFIWRETHIVMYIRKSHWKTRDVTASVEISVIAPEPSTIYIARYLYTLFVNTCYIYNRCAFIEFFILYNFYIITDHYN